MDLKAMDQMFQLEKRHLHLDYVTYRRKRLELRNEISLWLHEHKIQYTFTPCGAGAILHVHDRSLATLFKLTWM